MLAVYLAMLEDDEDKARFAAFYEKSEQSLYNMALKNVASPHMAEDIVHETMVRIIRHFDEFKKIQNSCQDPMPWSVIIMKNVSMSMLRSEQKYQPLSEDWDVPDLEDAETSDGYRRLVALIRSLPDMYRSVLELRLVAGWSSREIGALLHLRENTVDVRISRGRTLLKERMREEGYELDGL